MTMKQTSRNGGSMPPAVALSGVSKAYGKHEALHQVDAEIAQGEIFGLVGRNGAGKTTLMKLILGLSQPTSGTIMLNGSSGIAQLNRQRQSVGYLVGQSYFVTMNAVDNLKFLCKLKGINPRGELERVLELVGLKGVKLPLKGYSMGMKQRFGIANALLGSPKLIILDEPINGLDPQGIVEMRDLFRNLNEQEGVTLIISSHLLSELAMTATTFGVIHNGSMVAKLTRSELEHHTKAQRLEVVTSDNRRALALLQDHFGIRGQQSDGMILLEPGDASGAGRASGTARASGQNTILPEQVAAVVLNSGLDLKELHTRRQSLEDYYFSITGGEQNA